MDDWDDIVRDTGEDHDTDAHDVSDEDTTRNNIMKSEESADQANKSDTEQVDHHASPDDEQQCRICFGGVEDEEELGVSLFTLNERCLHADHAPSTRAATDQPVPMPRFHVKGPRRRLMWCVSKSLR